MRNKFVQTGYPWNKLKLYSLTNEDFVGQPNFTGDFSLYWIKLLVLGQTSPHSRTQLRVCPLLQITFLVGWTCSHIYMFLLSLYTFFSVIKNYLNTQCIHGLCHSRPWTADHATKLALAVMPAWFFQRPQVELLSSLVFIFPALGSAFSSIANILKIEKKYMSYMECLLKFGIQLQGTPVPHTTTICE